MVGLENAVRRNEMRSEMRGCCDCDCDSLIVVVVVVAAWFETLNTGGPIEPTVVYIFGADYRSVSHYDAHSLTILGNIQFHFPACSNFTPSRLVQGSLNIHVLYMYYCRSNHQAPKTERGVAMLCHTPSYVARSIPQQKPSRVSNSDWPRGIHITVVQRLRVSLTAQALTADRGTSEPRPDSPAKESQSASVRGESPLEF